MPLFLCIVVLLGSNCFGAEPTALEREEMRYEQSITQIRKDATEYLKSVAEPVRVATNETLREMERSEDLSLALTARCRRLAQDRKAQSSRRLPPTEVKEGYVPQNGKRYLFFAPTIAREYLELDERVFERDANGDGVEDGDDDEEGDESTEPDESEDSEDKEVS